MIYCAFPLCYLFCHTSIYAAGLYFVESVFLEFSIDTSIIDYIANVTKLSEVLYKSRAASFIRYLHIVGVRYYELHVLQDNITFGI